MPEVKPKTSHIVWASKVLVWDDNPVQEMAVTGQRGYSS